MNRKRFKAEKIVNKLREADVPLSKRQMVAWVDIGPYMVVGWAHIGVW